MSELIYMLKNAKREDRVEAIYWLILNLVGSLLPLWGTWFTFILINQPNGLISAIKRGELAIYSASVVAASFYVTTKGWGGQFLGNLIEPRFKRRDLRYTFPGGMLFNLLSVLLLLISTIFFAVATMATLPNFPFPINENVLLWGTFLTFVVTVAMSYIITVIDSSTPSISEIRETLKTRPLEELSRNFDSLK